MLTKGSNLAVFICLWILFSHSLYAAPIPIDLNKTYQCEVDSAEYVLFDPITAASSKSVLSINGKAILRGMKLGSPIQFKSEWENQSVYIYFQINATQQESLFLYDNVVEMPVAAQELGARTCAYMLTSLHPSQMLTKIGFYQHESGRLRVELTQRPMDMAVYADHKIELSLLCDEVAIP